MELRKLPIKIVYIEENDAIRRMTTDYLMEHVASIFTAKNAPEALELFHKERPDVVVTDLKIEGMDGLRFIRSLKQKKPDLPIFVTTDYDETLNLSEAIRHGITHYIYKQSDPQKLFDAIRSHFKYTQNGFLSLDIDAQGKIGAISDPFAEYLGYTSTQLIGAPLETILKTEAENGGPFPFLEEEETPNLDHLQAVFLTKDDKEKIMGGSADIFRDERGRLGIRTHWYPIDCLLRSHQEISEQLKKESYIKSLLQLHAHISQEAIRSDDPATFLQAILDRLPTVDQELAGSLLRQKNERLALEAATSTDRLDIPSLFSREIDLLDPSAERTFLPCFLAARHEQIVFVDNIDFLADSPFKRALVRQHIETLISIPLNRVSKEARYILTLFYSHRHRFDKEELELWQNIANTTAFGLATINLHIERDALIRKLDVMAHTDSLTGVLNRYRGVELLEHEIVRSQRYGVPFSVLFFDIDNFKRINDTYGHETGDKVLQKVADTVQKSLRRTDTLVRWGGEEFLILLPQTTLGDAVHLAQKLRSRIEQRESDTPVPVTASFGAVEWERDQSLDTLISRADAKMYEAKRSGRNRIAY